MFIDVKGRFIHEVGHLLTRSDAACQSFMVPGGQDGTVERWCERFAAGIRGSLQHPLDEGYEYIAHVMEVASYVVDINKCGARTLVLGSWC